MLTLAEPVPGLRERFEDDALRAAERTHPLVARWSRARSVGAALAPEIEGAALRERRERAEPVLVRGAQLIEAAAAELARRGCALVLADEEGVVLASRGLSALPRSLGSALREGSCWSEAVRGTNGIGTALAEGGPVAVVGGAHWDRGARDLVCYGAPVRDPAGRQVAVLDVSGPIAAADPLLGLLVQSLAAGIEGALQVQALQRPRRRPPLPSQMPAFRSIAGDDEALDRARRDAARFARTTLPILLLAETGTGKELFARAIHEAGGGAGPFVAVNCGAIPAGLLESELFGHAPGAFTGASSRGSPGKIGAASGGTLFLDEIAEMAPAAQAALLRVLEDGTYSPVGETRECRSRFRLISATCRDLPALVRGGAFRQDLFYRIQGATLGLPPVRERSDVPILAQALVEEIAAAEGGDAPLVGDDALEAIAARRWPGNVRELKMALRYAVVQAEGAPVIRAAHLPADPLAVPAAPSAGPSRRQAEGEALRRALERAGGNLTEASLLLGVARSTLYRMLDRHGLRR